MLERWIEELTDELDLPKIPREGNLYVLPMDTTLSIELTEMERGGVSFFCKIGKLPSEKQEEFFTQGMLANLMGQGTKGAVLGVSDDYQFLTLSLSAPHVEQYGHFRDLLEDFINSVDFWVTETQNPI